MTAVYFGEALKYGDNINTDIISPPQYMELPIEQAAKYAMSAIDPDFYKKANKDTILVAGNNFGSGSSRETSPQVLKYFGVKVLVAKSFARIFYRNAINLGIWPITCPEVDKIEAGDDLDVDPFRGIILNKTRNETYKCEKFPQLIFDLIEGGGLYEMLRRGVET